MVLNFLREHFDALIFKGIPSAMFVLLTVLIVAVLRA